MFNVFSRTDQSRREPVVKVREDQTSVLEECLPDTRLGLGAVPTTDPQLQVETGPLPAPHGQGGLSALLAFRYQD